MKKLINKFKEGKIAEGNLILILIAIIILLAIFSPKFLTANNIKNLVRQTSIIGVVAIGMTFVIISGGIDLSVGSILGVASIISSMLMVSGLPIFLAIIVAMVVCTLLGVINGIIVYDGKVPPFIATLGMMTAARGIVMLISNARMIAGLPRTFSNFAQITILGMPSLFFVWLLVIIATFIVTSQTVIGRNLFAFGSNPEAARLSGINIRTLTYFIYGISGFMCAIAGILMTSRLSNGIPTAGTGYELDAIAAAVVGGASLSGGSGTIIGTVLGALLIAIIRNGGNLLGINPFILQISVGVLIVVSVMIDQRRKASV
ncbi:MAG: ABC transporter permease [Spirochaetales bacterium]|uniref:ABC transporter permease n=1 Tax=Candidatus Thalassospirochaeta sargassi TaxID=3119039 RepID=A0AAJ1MI48_9SPIO|nr:ABC transporter permease [Spirochaetales bacterium]